jgi:hypothetical protein
MIDMFSSPLANRHLRRADMTSSSSRLRRKSRLAGAVLAALLVIASVASMPTVALAGAADNDSNVDARLVGYPSGKKVAIEKSSSTPAFLLFFFLVVVGCVPLFKNAKRD